MFNTLETITPETAERSVSDTRAKLAAAASTALGYTKLKSVAGPRPLLKGLCDMEIFPFTPDSVEKYLRSKESVGMYTGTRNLILRAGLSVIMAPVFLNAVAIASSHAQSDPVTAQASTVAIVMGVLIALNTVGLLITNRAGHGDRTVTKWAVTEIGNYRVISLNMYLPKPFRLSKPFLTRPSTSNTW